MGLGDRIANGAEELGALVKEAAGQLSGNQMLEAEGFAQEENAEAKQAIEHEHEHEHEHEGDARA